MTSEITGHCGIHNDNDDDNDATEKVSYSTGMEFNVSGCHPVC